MNVSFAKIKLPSVVTSLKHPPHSEKGKCKDLYKNNLNRCKLFERRRGGDETYMCTVVITPSTTSPWKGLQFKIEIQGKCRVGSMVGPSYDKNVECRPGQGRGAKLRIV